MANPNIDLLGAVYPTVAGVTLPTQGGGTATFPWVEGSQTITTNNTYDVTNLAQVVVNVSGGGGASNVVTGTFKGTTTGAAMDVNIPYTGSGYPIALAIYPKDGYQRESSAYNLLQQYAVMHFIGVKRETTAPTYATTGSKNQFVVYTTYKSSSSSAPNLLGTGLTNNIILTGSSVSSPARGYYSVSFVNSKKMSVFIAAASYGFAANIEYTYYVIYSS